MFRFEDVSLLFFLWIVPVLGLLYYWNWRRQSKMLATWGDQSTLSRLIQGWTDSRNWLRMCLLLVAVASLIIALANPQWGSKKEKVKAKSSDIFLALDISQSMMAEDISPNRLERAKRLASSIIESLKGNRIGLIFFAGNAYLQMPLTSDYAAAMLFVASANTSQAGTQGTAIGEAIDMAMKSYDPKAPNQKGLIILTDGEDHDAEALAKAKESAQKGLSIIAIGVGTQNGAPVPHLVNGMKQNKTDENGILVNSALNVDLLRDLAEQGNGSFHLIGEGNKIVSDIQSEVARMEKTEVQQESFSQYQSYFQYFLALGLLLIIIEFALPESKKV